MKIRINDKIAVDVQVTTTMKCPAGTAYSYYDIDYCIDGLCIHSATTGAIYGKPDVIAMLDRVYTKPNEYHYQDIENPDPPPTDGRFSRGTINGREAWYTERSLTHREAIIEAVKQIVVDDGKDDSQALKDQIAFEQSKKQA